MKIRQLTLKDIPTGCFAQHIDPARKNRSFRRNPLAVAGKSCECGVGLRTDGRIGFDLHGSAVRLRAVAGIDDESRVAEAFLKVFDPDTGAELGRSRPMRRGEAPVDFEFPLTNIAKAGLAWIAENEAASVDLLALEIDYVREKPLPYFPHSGIVTRHAEWIFPAAPEAGKPFVQHGLTLRRDGAPETGALDLLRTFPPRHPDPELYNLPFNLQVIQADGNPSAELAYDGLEKHVLDDDATEYVLKQRDAVAGLEVELHVTAFYDEDMFKVWTVIRNRGKKSVTLLARDAVNLALPFGKKPFLTTFRGSQYWEQTRPEESPVAHGTMVNSHCALSHNSQEIYPGCYLALDGRLREESGRVFGAALGWDGNWQYKLTRTEYDRLLFSAGALEEPHILNPGETYESPFVLFSLSGAGAGQVSRNFHRYMRCRGGLRNGNILRPVVLNSWEGLVFDFDAEKLSRIIRAAAAIGAEMFVLDDGWFGTGGFARNDGSAGLGDWEVNPAKLPGGLQHLIAETHRLGLKFGLWVEPEMVNTRSRLYQQHPEWGVAIPHREIRCGRGGTQLMLDLSRPEVEAFVYRAVAGILRQYPGIEYLKWDHNMRGGNPGAAHLGENQSALSDLHNAAFGRVMQRLRADFPGVMFQNCASGGGRADVGTMRNFDEFWCSDNSQGFHRIPIQWGFSHFLPACAQASHVSRLSEVPSDYKFRVDVAMSARLGVELDPSAIAANEVEVIRQGIAVYKQLRPIIHHGELYRGRAPHGSAITELTFVLPDKSEAVWFGFKRTLPACRAIIRAAGLAPRKRYRLEERNPDAAPRIRAAVRTGKELMTEGVTVDFPEQCASVVILLTAE